MENSFLKAISYLDQESSQQQQVLYMAGVISFAFARVAVKQSLLKSNGTVERDSQQRYENLKKKYLLEAFRIIFGLIINVTSRSSKTLQLY